MEQLDSTGFQKWDQMAEKGTKKGPILANFDQKSIKGTNLLFPGPNWTHCDEDPSGHMQNSRIISKSFQKVEWVQCRVCPKWGVGVDSRMQLHLNALFIENL